MRRVYYLYDVDNHPIVTVGAFADENGVKFARTISIYGEGEVNSLNKKQGFKMVNERFDNAAKITSRPGYVNEIFPRRVEDLYDRLCFNHRNLGRGLDDLFGEAEASFKKIDLKAIPTEFERYLFKMD